MTDKHGGLLDAAQQAVRMERIEGQHSLLAQRVSSGMESVASAMASLQIEVRGLTTKLGDLAGLQHAHDHNRTSIDEVKKSLGDLNTRLEEWFDDFDQRNQRKWEQYEKNRDRWRREHEAENEDDKRSLEKEIRGVRETTIRFGAVAFALALLGSTVVGGFIWNINYRFNEGKEDIADSRSSVAHNRNRIDQTNDALNDIKLYLARGGRMPAEPYVPPSQRNVNGNEQARQSRK